MTRRDVRELKCDRCEKRWVWDGVTDIGDAPPIRHFEVQVNDGLEDAGGQRVGYDLVAFDACSEGCATRLAGEWFRTQFHSAIRLEEPPGLVRLS